MTEHKKEIDLSSAFKVLLDNKKKIGISTVVTTFVAILYCLFATPIFMAQAIINPPKLTDAGTSFSQVISGLNALGGSGGGLLQKTDADVAIAILNTNAVKTMVVDKFNLIQRWKQQNKELARMALSSSVQLISDMKSGFVLIDVYNKDPKLAADIANYYTLALGQAINNVAYARANQRYTFYQNQLESAFLLLSQAEDELRKFSESNGVVAGQQTQVLSGISAQLQAQLIAAQVELRRMSYYAGAQNPDYLALESQVSSLKHQILSLNNQDADTNIAIPVGLAPKLANEYIRLMRNFKFKELVYEVMLKQSKAAQLDAQSEMEPLAIQIIDPAIVPLYKAKPKRLSILIIGFIFGLIVSSIYFIVRNRKKIIVEV